MSEKVETRVVKMEFDNAKFEKDVKQSINTLDKFDKRLRFEGVSDSVEKVTKKISAFEVAAITAIANISNRITNLGIRMIKSLSVDNIASGWDKFGEKTMAVATMAAQKIKIAGKVIDDYGKKMEVINEQLEKLNWFTDETSYNFTDMVNSIGKFTAAGQDLDKSVNAMMGIANWAALSGQNASKASSAMYQLAQAMGKGYVQLIDWKSIQNLSMDTVEFRETVLEAAVSMGELTKEADKFITKTGKKFTINQFAEELNSKWFTTDVLVNALGKYSAAIERIYEISQDTGLTASQIMKRYAGELDKFGLKAFKAAQEARTLSDALNSVKDAVSTGWMNTAEKIFGGYDESKELFTDLANELYDVFAEGGNFRNEILGLWNDLGGRADLFEHGDKGQGAFWNIYDSIVAVRDIVKDSWNTIFPKSAFESYNDQVTEIANNFKIFTDRLKNYTATIKTALEDNKKLSNIFTGLFSLIKIGALALNGIRYSLDPILTSAKNTLGYVTERLSYLVSHTSKMEGVINTINSISIKLHDTIESIFDVIDPRAVLGGILNFLKDIIRTIQENAPLEDSLQVIKDLFVGLKDSISNGNNISRLMTGILSLISSITKITKKFVELLSKYLVPVLNVIVNVLNKITIFASNILFGLLGFVGDLLTLFDNLLDSKSFDDAGSTLIEFVSNLGKNLKNAKPIMTSFINVLKSFLGFLKAIPELFNKITIEITGKSVSENLISFFDSTINALTSASNSISGIDVENKLKPLNVFVEGIINLFKGLGSLLLSLFALVGSVFSLFGDIFKIIADAINTTITNLDKETLKNLVIAASYIGILAGILVLLKNTLWGVQANINPIGYVLENISDALYKLASGYSINAIGYLIRSVGASLLEISMAMAIMSKSIDMKGFAKWSIFLISIAATIAIVIIALKEVKKTMESFKGWIATFKDSIKEIKDAWSTWANNKMFSDMLYGIASLVKSIGFAFIEIAAAFSLFNNVNNSAFDKAMETLKMFAIMVGALILLTSGLKDKIAVGGKGKVIKQTSKDIKSMGMLFLGIAVAFKSIAKVLVMLSSNSIDSTKVWEAIAMMSTMLGAIMIVVSIIALVSQYDLDVEKGTKSELSKDNGKAIASILLSLSATMLSIAGAVKILSDIKTDDIWKALGAIGAVMLALTFMVSIISIVSQYDLNVEEGTKSELTKDNGKAISKILISLSVTLMTIIGAVAIMTKMLQKDASNTKESIKQIIFLIGSISVLLIAVGAASKLAGDGQSLGKMVAVLVSITGMIFALIGAIKLLSDLSKENFVGFISGFIAIIALLDTITIMLPLLANTAKFQKGSAGKIIGVLAVIAGTIVAFVGIIEVLSLINAKDPNAIKIGVTVLTIFMVEITAVLAVLAKLSKYKLKSTNNIISLMASLSGIMLILSACLAIIASLKLGNAIGATVIMTTLFAQITAMMYILTSLSKYKYKSINNIITLMGVLTGAVTSVSTVLAIIGLLPVGRAITATITMSTIFAQIAAMMFILTTLSKQNYNSINSVVALMAALTSTIVVIGTSLAILALLPLGGVIAATVSMTTMFANLSASLIIISSLVKNMSIKDVVLASVILTKLSSTMLIFAIAMTMVSGVDWATIIAASVGFSVCLSTIIASMVLLSSFDISAEAMIYMGVALISMGASMFIFAAGMRQFETISWDTIAKGAIVVGGAFVLLAAAGLLLKTVGPTLMFIGIAMAGIGAGLYLISAMIPLFMEGMLQLAAFFDENSDALVGAIQGIANVFVEGLLGALISLFDKIGELFPSIFGAIGSFIEGLCGLLIEQGPSLMEAVVTLIDSLLSSLASKASSIAENLMTIVLAILTEFNKNFKTIANLLIDMFIKLLEVIKDRLPEIISKIVDVLIELVKSLFNNLGRLLDVALPLLFNFIIDLLSRLVKYIIPLAAAITKLALILIATMLRLILQASGFLAAQLIAFFGGLILLIIEVVKGMSNVIFEALKYIFVIIITTLAKVLRVVAPMLVIAGRIIGLSLVAGILDALDNSTIGQILKFIGIDVGKFVGKLDDQIAGLTDDLQKYGSRSGVEDAIKNAGNDIMSTVSNVTNFMGDITKQGLDQINRTVNDSLSGVSETVSTFSNQIGGYMAEGLEQGAYENQQSAEDAGAAISDAAMKGAREEAGIHSPSTEFIEIGKYMCEGLVIGIDENQNAVIDKAAELMNKTIVAANIAINNAINGNVLTITPVMDLSSIRAGANDISQIMSNVSGGGLRVSGSLASAASSELRSDKASASSTVINNGGDTFNATFNVTTNNPQSFSEDVDKELQHQRMMSKLAKGGAY